MYKKNYLSFFKKPSLESGLVNLQKYIHLHFKEQLIIN